MIMSENTLYYGDNLDILPRYIKDESVDLIYLDPPFKSNQDYNILFAEQNGSRAAAQIKAFEDTWRWDESAARAYEEVIETGGRVASVMVAFRSFLGENDMMAYLAMMAPRLMELRRVLKSTGSIYLHCDTTASHYLKLLMDGVFKGQNFQSEIIWKRTSAHTTYKRFGRVHDTIFHYSKSEEFKWSDPRAPQNPEYLEQWFRHIDSKTGRSFEARDLTGAGVRHGESGMPWKGVNPTEKRRHWAVPNSLIKRLGLKGKSIRQKLDVLDKEGLIFWPKKADGVPRLKWFIDHLEEASVPDVWNDIRPISAHAIERLGYPTQKPEALLERIIKASSNEGDVVLDPFCGCGTAVAVAQRLNRNWIGIDITHLAITLIKKRLFDTFSDELQYQVIGEPVDLSGARELAKQDKYQFQWWALGLVNARPVEPKKGADQGIDGRRYFIDGKRRVTKQIVFSVKSGHTGVKDIRDLRGVVERENAAIGVLITLETPTRDMRKEASAADFYHSDWRETKHSRLQILTIEELMSGKKLDLPVLARTPATDLTFKKAPKAKTNTNNDSLNFS